LYIYNLQINKITITCNYIDCIEILLIMGDMIQSKRDIIMLYIKIHKEVKYLITTYVSKIHM